MKKTILILIVLSSQFGLTQNFKQMKQSIHQFEVTALNGKKI